MVLMRAKTSVSFNKTVDSVAIGNAWEGPYQRHLLRSIMYWRMIEMDKTMVVVMCT
ncbi:hypothetical protein COCNU_scaffold022222G000050 [Cocos nucifera]|nr:hypothetical protein [Cocos nucifera]